MDQVGSFRALDSVRFSVGLDSFGFRSGRIWFGFRSAWIQLVFVESDLVWFSVGLDSVGSRGSDSLFLAAVLYLVTAREDFVTSNSSLNLIPFLVNLPDIRL